MTEPDEPTRTELVDSAELYYLRQSAVLIDAHALQPPLARLAQAVLDGRVRLRTECQEYDGVQYATTTIDVEPEPMATDDERTPATALTVPGRGPLGEE